MPPPRTATYWAVGAPRTPARREIRTEPDKRGIFADEESFFTDTSPTSAPPSSDRQGHILPSCRYAVSHLMPTDAAPLLTQRPLASSLTNGSCQDFRGGFGTHRLTPIGGQICTHCTVSGGLLGGNAARRGAGVPLHFQAGVKELSGAGPCWSAWRDAVGATHASPYPRKPGTSFAR